MNNELKKYIETVPAVADFVTEKDNDHDGVTEVIEKFFPEEE